MSEELEQRIQDIETWIAERPQYRDMLGPPQSFVEASRRIQQRVNLRHRSAAPYEGDILERKGFWEQPTEPLERPIEPR